jgi:formylglycine-generating enzyme required for sulfatase activity
MDEELKKIDKGLATGKVEGKRQWYVSRQGHTMVIVSRPGEFWMGQESQRHRQKIGRSFALTSKEVTMEQFLKFRKEHRYWKESAPTGDCPVNNVSWYDAVAYCNWLSEEEGVPKDQWCYLPNDSGKYAEGMKMAPNYLQRTGYRLPTEAEWEYACSAGAETEYSFGRPEELLVKYANYGNALGRSLSVGKLRPNDQGLFDMHGNGWEWCQSIYKSYATGEKALDDIDDSLYVDDKQIRVERGGSYTTLAWQMRSTQRYGSVPSVRTAVTTFRAARTIIGE